MTTILFKNLHQEIDCPQKKKLLCFPILSNEENVLHLTFQKADSCKMITKVKISKLKINWGLR
jgi:hypothetical protein